MDPSDDDDIVPCGRSNEAIPSYQRTVRVSCCGGPCITLTPLSLSLSLSLTPLSLSLAVAHVHVSTVSNEGGTPL